MSIGLAAVLLPMLFVVLGLACGGRVGLGTLLDLVLVGPVLGVVVAVLPDVEPLAVRIPMYAAGFASITAGIVLVILPDLGAGPAEVLMLAIADRGLPLAPVRTAIELVCAMGGQIGVGTVAFAVLVGPALRHGLTFAGYDATRAATRSDAASPGA
jgi:uncharacterized membrane protein YczE